jgi:glycosyltransferase involved in cell wall biosynthesis
MMDVSATHSGPRVLFVIPGEAQGSSMVFARRQATELMSRGVEVESFHLRSRTSPSVLWSELQRFRAVVARFAPDVIHAHFGTVTAAFTIWAARRIPVVITYRGSDLNRVPTARGLRALFGRVLSQFSAARAARIVCVSRGLRDRLWWHRERVTILPSGVDTILFRPISRVEARRQLGWDQDIPVALFNAGHDARNKRLDLANAAVELSRVEFPNLRFEVTEGDVPPDRMPILLNAADCLLVTSDAEGSPSVVQEAIATNLPVVSVDVGDVAERLRGISSTHIVDRSPGALASALCTVLKMRERSNGRSRVREICSAHIADELTHLYREAVAKDSPQKVALWNITRSSQPSRS